MLSPYTPASYDSVTSYCNRLLIIDFWLRLEPGTTVWAFTAFNLMLCCRLPTPYWQASPSSQIGAGRLMNTQEGDRDLFSYRDSSRLHKHFFFFFFLLQGIINNRVIEQRTKEMVSPSMYEIFFIGTPWRPKGGLIMKVLPFSLE